MNISKEQIDALNAVVSIEVVPQDYSEKVEKSIKETARKMNLPGFRPGKVPAGVVKRMYGQSILADEINKILNESLYSYLEENKIQILGNPLPKEDDPQHKFEPGEVFRFSYEIGLSPEFEVKLDPKKKIDYQRVVVTDEVVEKEVDALRKRYGQIIPAEKTEDDDILAVEVTVPGAEGEDLISNKSATIFLNRMKEEDRAMFVGTEAGQEIKADIHKVWPEKDVLAKILEVSEDIAADIKNEGNIRINQIHRLKAADLNEEFFEKIYGPDSVKTEEEMREKVKAEVEDFYQKEADRRFYKEVSEMLTSEVQVPLPEDFLKRWLNTVADKPMTEDELNHEFSHYKKYVQWELIENKVLADNDIKVEPSEVMDFVKDALRLRYKEYGISDVPEQELEKSARTVLAKKEEARAAFDALKEQKLIGLFKRSFKLEEKELTPEAFSNLK